MQAFRPETSAITDYYEMGEVLGEGGYGTVHMATPKNRIIGTPATATSAPPPVAAAVPERGHKSEVSPESSDAGGSDSDVCVAVKKVSWFLRSCGFSVPVLPVVTWWDCLVMGGGGRCGCPYV